jgi:hypothetical protein
MERTVQLEGNLAQLSLRELIEMITYSSVRGMLEIRDGDLAAQLYFRDGQPCHATVDDLRGMDAVGRMFEMIDAQFRFYAGSYSEEETLWQESNELIRRGEELARGWARIRPLIASHQLVPRLTESGMAPRVNVEADSWPVLAGVNGQRTIKELTTELGVGLYEVCEALAQLRQQGLVTFEAPKSQVEAAQPSVVPAKQGFFERLIEKTLEEDAQNPGSRYAPPEQRYVETE